MVVFWSRYIPGGGLLLSSFVTQAVPRLRRETLLLLLLLVSPVRTYQHFSFKSCRECYGVLLNLTFSKIQNGYLAPISYINIVFFLSEYYSQVSFSFLLLHMISVLTSPPLSSHSPFCLLSFYPPSSLLLTVPVSLSCLTPFVSSPSTMPLGHWVA